MSKRLYPHSRVRYWYTYDIEEVCDLFNDLGLHPQTVRSWLKDNLKSIDGGRPRLIHGNDLIVFLKKRNHQHKCVTQLNQLYCMGCGDAQFVFKNMVFIEQNQNLLKVQARCRVCKSIMHKNYKIEALPELRKAFKLVDVSELYDPTFGTDKTQFDARDETPSNESEQGSLF